MAVNKDNKPIFGAARLQNDDLPVGRILSRREVLSLFGAAGLMLAAGCAGSGAASSTSSGSGGAGTLSVAATPAETEGPYFVDENLNRSDLTAGTTRASVVNGLPLALTITVSQISGGVATALSGAHVDVWHADAIGVYSDEAVQNTSGQTWLRGYQVTDSSGAAKFTTIYPGWYPGRATHIHFKIRLYSASGQKTYEFTSQLFADDAITDAVYAGTPYNSRGQRDTTNATDSVYNTQESNGVVSGSQLLLSLSKASSGTGYVGSFSVGLQIS